MGDLCVYMVMLMWTSGGKWSSCSSWYNGARWNIWKDFIGWFGWIMAQRKYKCLKMLQSITGSHISMIAWEETMIMYLTLEVWSCILHPFHPKQRSVVQILILFLHVVEYQHVVDPLLLILHRLPYPYSFAWSLASLWTIIYMKATIRIIHAPIGILPKYLLDSFNSCWDSGWITGGRIFDDLTSKRHVFCDVCVFESCQLFVVVACAWSGNKGNKPLASK